MKEEIFGPICRHQFGRAKQESKNPDPLSFIYTPMIGCARVCIYKTIKDQDFFELLL